MKDNKVREAELDTAIEKAEARLKILRELREKARSPQERLRLKFAEEDYSFLVGLTGRTNDCTFIPAIDAAITLLPPHKSAGKSDRMQVPISHAFEILKRVVGQSHEFGWSTPSDGVATKYREMLSDLKEAYLQSLDSTGEIPSWYDDAE